MAANGSDSSHMEYAKEPPLAVSEGEAASASFRQLMPQSVSINPDLLALPVTGAEGPEVDDTVLTGDLPISREALISSRQQKPLFSHTPGRRALPIRQLEHHQTGQPDLSETNVSVCHKNHAFQAKIEKVFCSQFWLFEYKAKSYVRSCCNKLSQCHDQHEA